MKKFRMNQAGFTLIELLIVVIIVAVLAVVGIPLLTGNVERARLTEADASLGTIRTSMRAEFAENGTFPVLSNASPIDDGVGTDATIGLKAGDLTGRFFEDDDFLILSSTAGTPADNTTDPPTAAVPGEYCVRVTGDTAGSDAGGVDDGNPLTAPAGNQVDNLSRSIDENGYLYANATCTGTPLNAS